LDSPANEAILAKIQTEEADPQKTLAEVIRRTEGATELQIHLVLH
jgi:hypothetical protein